MSNDTITISISDYDNTMNSSFTGISAQDISTITLGNTTSDTIIFSNLDEYSNVTKAEHNELLDRVAKLEAIMAEEAELRAKHPALQTAYDEYRLLLVLTKQHTPDILTDE